MMAGEGHRPTYLLWYNGGPRKYQSHRSSGNNLDQYRNCFLGSLITYKDCAIRNLYLLNNTHDNYYSIVSKLIREQL